MMDEDNLARHFSLNFNTSDNQLPTSHVQPGKLYEQLLFMYTLINNQNNVFDLGKEIKFGDKWDDLVVREHKNHNKHYTFVQIKLVDDNSNTIDSHVLLGKRKISLKENDFKLQKYLKSYLRIKDQLTSRNDNSKIKTLIVFTNAQLNKDELNKNVGNVHLKTSHYNIVPNTNLKFAENIEEITFEITKVKDSFICEMKRNLVSDFIQIAEELAIYAENSNPEAMNLDKDYLAYYHISLIDENVIEIISQQSGKKMIKHGKFTQSFVDIQNLSCRAQKLRIKLTEIFKKKGVADQILKVNMKNAKWPVSDDFDKRITQEQMFLPNYDINDKDIIDFFKVLELRVKQLDVKGLINMILNVEIKKTFLEYYDTDPKLVEFLINDFVQSWKTAKSISETWIFNQERSKFVENLKIRISKPKAIHKTRECIKTLLDICYKYDLYYDDSCLFGKRHFNNNYLAIRTQSNILTSVKLLQSLFKMKLQDSIFIDLDKLMSQKEIIKLVEAFRSDDVKLFIISYTFLEFDSICEELFTQLTGTVMKNKQKTVVFITSGTDDPLIRKFSNQIGYKEYEDKFISLQYLKQASKVLEKKIVVQNQALILADFIGNSQTDYNVVDAKVIDCLIKDKKIQIGSEPLSTSHSDGAYLDLAEDLNVNTTMNTLLFEESNDIYLISSEVGPNIVKRILMSLEVEMSEIARKSTIESFIHILNQNDIGKPFTKKIQVCNFIINKDNFKKICLCNPNRKNYWITMKYDDALPKFTLEQIFNPEFYIKGQRFNNEIVINQNIKTLLLSNELSESFVIILHTRSEFENWMQLFENKDKQQLEKKCQMDVVRFVYCEKDGKVIFEEIIRNNPSRTVHLLKFERNNLIWFKTYGSKEKIIKVRERKHMRTKALIEEDDLIKEIKDKKGVVFVGDPGTGKSTALVKLYETNYISEIGAEENLVMTHWLIRLNLRDHLQAVKDVNVDAQDAVTIIKEVALFLSQVDKNLNSELAKKLLGIALMKVNFKKPVLIIFDGFDEVLDQVDRNKIIFLLRAIKNKTQAKFWITSRIHFQDELETAVTIFAIKLEKMNNDQIHEFIRKYLENIFNLFFNNAELRDVDATNKMKYMKINEFSITFTRTVQNIFKGDISKFIGTPLQLYLMLAETIRYFINWINYDNILSPDISFLGTDIWTVYKKFIEGRLKVYFKKVNINEQLKQEQHLVMFDDYHRNLAKSQMFNSSVKQYIEYFRDIHLMVGIIKSYDGHIEFIHPTFREYFATEEILHWVVKWKKDANNNFINFNKQEYLLGDVLLKPEFQMVRRFLNARLLNEKFQNIQLQELYYDKHVLFEAARENNIGILKFILENVDIANVNSFYPIPLLHEAVARGSWELINFLIEEKVDINSKDHYASGETAMHKIARSGAIDTLKFLIENGADVNAKTNHNSSVLHYACVSKKLEVFEILIENGANVNSKDDYGVSVLYNAVKYCNLEVIKVLIKEGADINATNNINKSILHSASEYSKLEIVEYLVANGAKMNKRDKQNKTILHSAAAGNKLEILKFLVSKQVGVNATDCDGVSVLHIATKRSNIDMIKFLIAKGAKVNAKNKYNESVLHCAAEFNKLEVVEFLIANGVDVNVKTRKKVSILHRAAETGNLEMVKLLISKGLDMHAKDINNKSVLHYAAESGNFEMVKFFIEKGTHINEPDNTGMTILHIAAQVKNIKMVKFLLEKNANVHAKTCSGMPILSIASECSVLDLILLTAKSNSLMQPTRTMQDYLDDATKIVKILVSKGVNIDDTNINGKSALHWGAETSNFALVKFLIENGANLRATDKNGTSILHSAIESGNLEMVKLVMSSGSDVNARDIKGITVLHKASENGCLDIVKYLIAKGADVNAKDEDSKNVLHRKFLNFPVLKFLVEAGVDVTAQDNNNSSVLHYVIQSFDLDMAKFCISLGANVYAKDKDGKSVLHFAAETHYLAMIRYLVRVGADVNALDKDNKPVLHIAIQSKDLDIVDFLVKNNANVKLVDKNKTSVLHCAASLGLLEMVKYFIKKGVNINTKDNDDKSVLHVAAESGSWDVFEFLIANGASVNEHDIEGSSILHIAAKNNNLLSVQLLIEAGADVNAVDSYKRSILHYAANSFNLDLVKFIVEAGVNVDSRDIDLQTAGYIAAQNQNFAIVKYLLEKGADVNAFDKDLKSILHVVAKFGDLELVKLLVLYGADVNAKDAHKTTVLHNAVESSNVELVKFLVTKGLDIDAKDEFGSSVLHTAAKFEDNFDVIKFLVASGAHVDTTDNNDNTVLHSVAKFGDLEIVEFLIANGANIKAKDKDGNSILQFAEESANLDLILYIVKAGGDSWG